MADFSSREDLIKVLQGNLVEPSDTTLKAAIVVACITNDTKLLQELKEDAPYLDELITAQELAYAIESNAIDIVKMYLPQLEDDIDTYVAAACNAHNFDILMLLVDTYVITWTKFDILPVIQHGDAQVLDHIAQKQSNYRGPCTCPIGQKYIYMECSGCKYNSISKMYLVTLSKENKAQYNLLKDVIISHYGEKFNNEVMFDRAIQDHDYAAISIYATDTKHSHIISIMFHEKDYEGIKALCGSSINTESLVKHALDVEDIKALDIIEEHAGVLNLSDLIENRISTLEFLNYLLGKGVDLCGIEDDEKIHDIIYCSKLPVLKELFAPEDGAPSMVIEDDKYKYLLHYAILHGDLTKMKFLHDLYIITPVANDLMLVAIQGKLETFVELSTYNYVHNYKDDILVKLCIALDQPEKLRHVLGLEHDVDYSLLIALASRNKREKSLALFAELNPAYEEKEVDLSATLVDMIKHSSAIELCPPGFNQFKEYEGLNFNHANGPIHPVNMNDQGWGQYH